MPCLQHVWVYQSQLAMPCASVNGEYFLLSTSQQNQQNYRTRRQKTRDEGSASKEDKQVSMLIVLIQLFRLFHLCGSKKNLVKYHQDYQNVPLKFAYRIPRSLPKSGSWNALEKPQQPNMSFSFLQQVYARDNVFAQAPNIPSGLLREKPAELQYVQAAAEQSRA